MSAMSGPIAWDDRHEAGDRPFRLRGRPLTRRLIVREIRRQMTRDQLALARTHDPRCRHHRHAGDTGELLLVPLWDEPKGSNPAQLIGYLCRVCSTIFTSTGAPSAAEVPTRPKVPNSPLRPSKAHAARVRAVDRLGVAYDAVRQAEAA